MEVKWRNIIVGLFLVVTLAACSDNDSNNKSAGAPAPTPAAEEWLLFANDGSADSNNISVFKATTASSPIQVPIPKLGQTVTMGKLPLGEIHFANGKAYIVVTEGLIGPAPGNLPSGGLVVIDLAHPDTVETVLVLASTSTGRASRIVHVYIDPEGKFLWANNDGPRRPNPNQPDPTADASDSVFRVNVDPTDTDATDPGGKYLDFVDIQVGNGHKKSAFGRPSATQPTAQKVFFTSDLTERRINVIDDDPASGTYGQVIKIVRNVPASPHGMDYAPNSGRSISGITGGGIVSVDATLLNAANFPDVDCTGVTNGSCVGSAGAPNAGVVDPSVYVLNTGEGTNPNLFAGYVKVHTNGHDKDTAYTTGRDSSISKGWVTAIDPGAGNTPPSTVKAIDLGDGGANNIAHGGDHHGGKIYLPSNSGTINDQVVVIDADHDSATFNTILKRITVGASPGNLRYSGDGRLVMAPITTGNTVKVIDTETDEVIDTLTLTAGTTAKNTGLVHLPANGAENNR